MADNAPVENDVIVLGGSDTFFRDLYHTLLRQSWPQTIASITFGYLVSNALFAVVYHFTGGISNVAAGSYLDAFFFSVQTMVTIGYGAMVPLTRVANVVVVFEAIFGVIVNALVTGLVFSKFSRSTARVAFMTRATISPRNGVPTLSLRFGNQRGNLIIEAQIRVTLIRTETTLEGERFYRLQDLKLVRDRSAAFTRSWTVMHVIDESSVLFGATPESLAKDETEILVSMVGTDDTSFQPVHARHTYSHTDIVFGARPADILTERPDGKLVVDLSKFDDIVPVPAPASPPRG